MSIVWTKFPLACRKLFESPPYLLQHLDTSSFAFCRFHCFHCFHEFRSATGQLLHLPSTTLSSFFWVQFDFFDLWESISIWVLERKNGSSPPAGKETMRGVTSSFGWIDLRASRLWMQLFFFALSFLTLLLYTVDKQTVLHFTSDHKMRDGRAWWQN